jgi:integrator complex subunit 11
MYRVVYTGDYNMTADRHLGGAWIEPLKPDLCITETTYANSIRDPKRAREREFFKTVHETLDRGGKILIPVFALGRAQELCILLETYWSRTGIKYPIYFAGGLVEKANFYYKLFTNWTNEKIKKSFIAEGKNMFEFKHVKNFEQHLVNSSSPMVLFATPGMMNAGTSLAVFKDWCGDEKNTLIIPGYCSPGSIGHKVLSMKKKIEIDKKYYNIKCRVMSMSFSAHVDSKGIMEFLTYLNPSNILMVHGDNEGMENLKKKVIEVLKIPCKNPKNHTTTVIPIVKKIPFQISLSLLNHYYANSLLSENTFVIPNAIFSDFGKKNQVAKLQTSIEFVYSHYLNQIKKSKFQNKEEIKVAKKAKKQSFQLSESEELDESDLFNKNTRY